MTKKSTPRGELTQTMVRLADTTVIRLNDAAAERGIHRNLLLEKAIEFYLDRLPSVDMLLAANDKPTYRLSE